MYKQFTYLLKHISGDVLTEGFCKNVVKTVHS